MRPLVCVQVPGYQISGIVTAVGKHVSHVKVVQIEDSFCSCLHVNIRPVHTFKEGQHAVALVPLDAGVHGGLSCFTVTKPLNTSSQKYLRRNIYRGDELVSN